jgi:hypothetical protein
VARLTLEQLVRDLQRVHADRLRCVLLYGSAAEATAPPVQRDQNVLVLVEAIDLRQLEMLGATTRAWAEAGNPPPLELTLAEWERSADIFPMEYADILARHRVLVGALPGGVQVTRAQLRVQAEFEAMGKVLRLRQGIMHAGTDAGRQRNLLRASHGTLMVIFRATVRVLGDEPPADRAALIARVAAVTGADAAPFQRVLTLVRGASVPDGELEALLFGTLRGLEQVAAWLDRHEVAGDAGAAGDPGDSGGAVRGG